MLRCATQDCPYAVGGAEFGGFCCKKCHVRHLLGQNQEHGYYCQKQLVPPGTRRSAPTPPPELLPQATSKKALKRIRQLEWEKAEQQEAEQATGIDRVEVAGPIDLEYYDLML